MWHLRPALHLRRRQHVQRLRGELVLPGDAAYEKARAGEGPSLIECLTYRYSGHSRADPAKYRPEGELEKWKERDPIKIYRERLKAFGIADDVVAKIDADVRRQVDEATEKCKAAPMPPLDILTTDVYADGGWAWRN